MYKLFAVRKTYLTCYNLSEVERRPCTRVRAHIVCISMYVKRRKMQTVRIVISLRERVSRKTNFFREQYSIANTRFRDRLFL